MKNIINFQQEFEFQASDECLYDVTVVLAMDCSRRTWQYKIDEVIITDYLGNELDNDHPMYREIRREAKTRIYDVQLLDGSYENNTDEQVSYV